MYYKGIGVSVNKTLSAEYFKIASTFGQTNAIYHLGMMYYEVRSFGKGDFQLILSQGDGVERSLVDAETCFYNTALFGEWSEILRLGLNHFIRHEYSASFLAYLSAAECGKHVLLSLQG